MCNAGALITEHLLQYKKANNQYAERYRLTSHPPVVPSPDRSLEGGSNPRQAKRPRQAQRSKQPAGGANFTR